jgi:hypothetical protein
MPRVREKQMSRLRAQMKAPDDAAAWRAAALRARVKVGAFLRQALAQLQIDPTRAAMLSVCEEAVRELALSADGPEPSADPAVLTGERHCDAPAAALAARIDVLVRCHGEGEGIDFARASLAETLAWCAARLE